MSKLFKFEIHLNEHCNLNCKCCDHFSPLAKEEYADIKNTENDLKRMSELVGDKAPVSIYLLGGEPLLNPNVTDFFDITRKYFPNVETATIRLITNGILLGQQSDEFWKNCQKNNIVIAPTRYPIKIDYDPICKKAEEYDITFEFFHSDEPQQFMYCSPISIDGSQNYEESFNSCHIASRCAFLKDGKIYSCPRIPNIYHFNRHFELNLEVTEKDFLDIYNIEKFEDVIEFLHTPKPFCKYCDVKNLSKTIPWGISEKKLEEWDLSSK